MFLDSKETSTKLNDISETIVPIDCSISIFPEYNLKYYSTNFLDKYWRAFLISIRNMQKLYDRLHKKKCLHSQMDVD